MTSILLDEDIHKSAAEQLRLRGYNAIHIVEAGRAWKSDEEQLLFADTEERVIITFNVKDYVKLHEIFLSEKKHHSGIILSKQIPIGEFIKKLAKLLHEEETFENSIFFL